MKNIKLFAIDIDGVILKDTFSPVLHTLILRHGGDYTRDIERNVFSRNQIQAANYIIETLEINITAHHLIDEYFTEREAYLKHHDGGLNEDALETLALLSEFKLPILCYGGLEKHKIHKEFLPCMDFFDDYICTNSFRPGMKEIIYSAKLSPTNVLFIDDVNTVAETCKNLGTGFIGLPPSHTWGWQDSDMKRTGVVHRLSSLTQITKERILEIDIDPGKCFKPQPV
ncbi:HAD family hydrolase [Teredinibacter haidensis]|uniref:HAD family hydrolase n=1 Tax=Teredinibacter haidensis TaxID=2731755 RepID=UPI000948E7C5|nr:hypothetical protein [Teredinibacter haidensis]